MIDKSIKYKIFHVYMYIDIDMYACNYVFFSSQLLSVLFCRNSGRSMEMPFSSSCGVELSGWMMMF